MPAPKGNQYAKGHGRPKGSKDPNTLKRERLQAYIIRRFIAEKKPIIDALIAKAKAQDVQAIRELLDRALGRSVTNLKSEGPIELAPLTIQIDQKNDD